MTTEKKVRLAGIPISDSVLVKRGRKGLMKAAGIGNMSARAPLTQQMLDTLESQDSYVTIPLKGTRTKATTIFNLKTKATKANVTLHYTMSTDEKTVYAWFVKPTGKTSSKPNGKADTQQPVEASIQ